MNDERADVVFAHETVIGPGRVFDRRRGESVELGEHQMLVSFDEREGVRLLDTWWDQCGAQMFRSWLTTPVEEPPLCPWYLDSYSDGSGTFWMRSDWAACMRAQVERHPRGGDSYEWTAWAPGPNGAELATGIEDTPEAAMAAADQAITASRT